MNFAWKLSEYIQQKKNIQHKDMTMGCSTTDTLFDNLKGLSGEKTNQINLKSKCSVQENHSAKDSLKVRHCALVKLLEEKPKNSERLCEKRRGKDSNSENVIKNLSFCWNIVGNWQL